MPTLRWTNADGVQQSFLIYKSITTIGKALGNDVSIEAEGVAEHHAQIAFDGRDFNLEEIDKYAELAINGKKKRRARLVHQDRILIGGAELRYSMFAEVAVTPNGEQRESAGLDLAGLQKLHAFSERLMDYGKGDIDDLLHLLLDSLLELTGAERGALVLVEEGAPSVRAVRDVQHDLITKEGSVSDSIVRHVLTTKRPLIVSDALTDASFGKSESVVALNLSSAMCVPLLAHAELLGALYVGSGRIKGLFDRSALDVLTIFAGQASLILQNAMLVRSLRADKSKLEKELSDKRFGLIIGSCPSMLEVYKKLSKVASTDVSVLITGETGTGKELIAHEVHRRSPRVNGPFVSINCGAIPENLIEAELFGYVKGAFTGAVNSRIGKFQAAQAGTLFLDEIGELPINLQVKLVRALQERVVMRVGDTKTEKVDIRVIAATNRVLEDEIKRGNFREDLYYRLNVVNIFLPPLRDRGEDVLIIAKAILSKYADELGSRVAGFAPAALSALRKYSWPGNIRELENRIKKGLVMSEKSLLQPEDLDLSQDESSAILPLEKAKEDFQRRYVLEALARNNGNRTQTARELGVDPRTIFRYLEVERSSTPPSPEHR